MYKKQEQKRRTSTRKTSSKKRNVSKAKKGKVTIPAYKAIILCAVIITLCMGLLLVTSVKESKPENTGAPIAQRFEEKAPTPPAAAPEKPAPQQKPASTPKKDVQPPAKKSESQVKPEQQTKPAQQKKPEPQKPAQQPEKKTYNFPKASNGANLIFVFDDGGQNNSHLEKFLQLPFPITVAVLPQLANSKTAAQKVRASGNEVILHQPMQSISNTVNPGPGAITPDMNDAQIITQLFLNINEIGPVAGMNNHEGSAITADAEKMAIILQTASENGIYFLDSRTNVETKVPYVAHELGYSYYERNIFLDNEKTEAFALKELRRGLDIANKNGNVIMIGHIWSADFLPAFLQKVYPELKAAGYTFTTVSNSTPKR